MYNKNYGGPLNPAELVTDTKPTSSSDETQVTVTDWHDMGFGKDFGIAGFINPRQTRETVIGSQIPRCVGN